MHASLLIILGATLIFASKNRWISTATPECPKYINDVEGFVFDYENGRGSEKKMKKAFRGVMQRSHDRVSEIRTRMCQYARQANWKRYSWSEKMLDMLESHLDDLIDFAASKLPLIPILEEYGYEDESGPS